MLLYREIQEVIALLDVIKISYEHAFNPLNDELNPICHLLALLRAHHILHVSRMRVNSEWLPR